MISSTTQGSFAAPANGGENGELIRARDWSTTELGCIDSWPQSLKSVVDLVLASPVAMIVLWGPQLVQLYNDAYGVIAGHRHPQALGQPTRECWPEVWTFNAPIYEAVWRGEVRSFQSQLLSIERQGVAQDAWFDLAYSPLRNGAGAVAGVLVTVVETTLHLLAERRITTQAQRQRRLFEQAPGFICILSGPDHVCEFGNEAYARLVGQRDFIGKSVREAFPDIAGQGFYEKLDAVYASGVAFAAAHLPLSMQRTPGAPPEERYIDFTYAPVLDDNGAVTGIFAQGHDVTDAHLARQSLRESEARLLDLNAELERRVIERSRELSRTWHVSPDLLSVINAQGRIEASNPAWTTILGWSQEEIRQTPVFDFIHPDDLEASRAGLARLARGEVLLFFENRYRCKSGEWRWLCWVSVPEDGKFYCSARDITESKNRAAALQIIEGQLRQAQKMEAVGQLTGGIAHDFNNMLAGVLGGLDIIQQRLASKRYDDVDRFVEAARQCGMRAASLVHRLMAFSRLQELNIETLDPAALAAGMDDMLRRTLGSSIALMLKCAPQTWAVAADASQLENALLNLAINARDAMPHGGELLIKTSNERFEADDPARPHELAPGDYVAICVGDTGTGMPQEVVDRAFDPFYTTKPIGQGTGLGLSMIYGFARQSLGHVAIASHLGEGTQVTLYLPRAATLASKSPVPVALKQPSRWLGCTVLLVDDEAAVRLMIATVLGELGVNCHEASDADAALTILGSAQGIDLLITDVGLPGMNGRQLADIARTLRPGLKVLFVTGYAGTAVLDASALGDDFGLLAKPFPIDALSAKVASMLPEAAIT
jgi:PAS domain S-box-containing protein